VELGFTEQGEKMNRFKKQQMGKTASHEKRTGGASEGLPAVMSPKTPGKRGGHIGKRNYKILKRGK